MNEVLHAELRSIVERYKDGEPDEAYVAGILSAVIGAQIMGVPTLAELSGLTVEFSKYQISVLKEHARRIE